MARPLVFFKTEWMEFYDGRKGDRPQGKFHFVTRTGQAHEDHNFLRQGKYCYGYVPVHGAGGNSRLRLDRHFGTDPEANAVDHIDVVFIASSPDGRGVVVVGWYEDARVYPELHEYGSGRLCHARVEADRAHRVPVDERWLRIPNPPRRANVWYAKGRPELVARVRRLIAGARNPKPIAKTRKQDVPKRLLIEARAYKAVTARFQALEYSVSPVWRDHVGWDLEATRGELRLLIEVKGTEQSEVRAELTPNEYACSERKAYRICIVTDVLAHPIVHTFSRNYKGIWYDEDGARELHFEPQTGARLTTSRVKP